MFFNKLTASKIVIIFVSKIGRPWTLFIFVWYFIVKNILQPQYDLEKKFIFSVTILEYLIIAKWDKVSASFWYNLFPLNYMVF